MTIGTDERLAWYCCQSCGEPIGLLGRVHQWLVVSWLFGLHRFCSPQRDVEQCWAIDGKHLAIAMEARQRRDAEERPDPKDDSAARRDRPNTPSLQTPQGGDS